MSYVTHNEQDDIWVEGSHLQGYIKAKYTELVALFGKPTDGDGYKVDAEWNVKFDDGIVASIYNYKDGPNYCGPDGVPVHKITDWHIGGTTKRAVDQVQIALDLHREGAAKQKSAAEELFESREAMLITIESKRGRNFAQAVELANMVAKQMQLFSFVLHAAEAGSPPPQQILHALGETMSTMAARILDRYCQAMGVAADRAEARELMAWADRLDDLEQAGIKPILEEYMQKRGAK
jgi:hypothetical protein